LPTYEYKCKKCHKNFEAVHGIHDTVEVCEYCGGKVRRVFHPIGIVFKGSGFYATDSRSSSSKGQVPSKEERDSKDKALEKSVDKKPAEPKKDKSEDQVKASS
jgi:putative FmdB family regulatory protein